MAKTESAADKFKREMAEAAQTPEQIAQIEEDKRTPEQQKILDDAKAAKFAQAEEAERTREAEKASAETARRAQIEQDLKEAGAAAKQAAINDDGGDEDEVFPTNNDPIPANDAREAAEAAVNKLRLITQSFPLTTPNEHTVFGANGLRITLGDLRDAFMMNRR